MSHGRVIAAVSIDGLLGAGACVACAAGGYSAWHLGAPWGGSRLVAVPVALVAGLLAGRAVAGLSRWVAVRWRWGRSLHAELRSNVLGTSARAALALALASAVGEELFFRGGVQSALARLWGAPAGLCVAALLFGLVHIPWNRRLLPWTASAVCMGLILGLLYLATGEVLAPIVAHALVNHENMRFILRHAPEEHAPAVRAPRSARAPS